MKFHAAVNTSIAAIQYEEKGGLIIRLYCQGIHHSYSLLYSHIIWIELGSSQIKELVYDKSGWRRGSTDLPVALSGTSLAALTHVNGSRQISIYYQTERLTINECWIEGDRIELSRWEFSNDL